jgi:arginyl-tRNA synthetase
MSNQIQILAERFKEAAFKAFPQLLEEPGFSVEITPSTQESFGDYQCNSAMKLAKSLKLAPRAIAEAIAKEVNSKDEGGGSFIAKIEVAGPGFINISLDPSYVSKKVEKMMMDPFLGVERPAKRQRIIVEFSSPNTAKEMHVGHLRSTIIGDSLARLFEFLGHDVLRLNHIGDWGTAFGMLIVHMKEVAKEVLVGKKKTDLAHLMQWYKESKQRFDSSPEFKKQAQLEVVSLQRGDPEPLKAWKIICDLSEEAYQEIYDLLGVKLITRGESYYNPMLAEVVADLESKGLVTVSGGAKCVFLEGFQNREGEPLPLMIQKSDGGYNYDTTDMAAIRHRIEEERADRIIIVTDAGQSTHFQLVIKTAEKAGYLDPEKVRVDHVTFGLVLGADGKKFRTRSGDTEKLIDLLSTAVEKSEEILAEKNPEMEANERAAIAKALGIGAVKYADLSCHRVGDYHFSYERMLRFEGNTAAFLMYAYTRIAGIKRKISLNAKSAELNPNSKLVLEHPSEISLGVHLLRFNETLDYVSQELLPNRLTDYLYNLAEKFNAFFRDCRVEGSPQQSSRLMLCEAVARTMKQGFDILGLTTVEKM